MYDVRFVQTHHDTCVWTWAYVMIHSVAYGLGAYPAAAWPAEALEAAIAQVVRWQHQPIQREAQELTRSGGVEVPHTQRSYP